MNQWSIWGGALVLVVGGLENDSIKDALSFQSKIPYLRFHIAEFVDH